MKIKYIISIYKVQDYDTLGLDHIIRLQVPRFIEVPEPSQVSELSCICLLWVSI
jgi:hypothetical protein